MNVLFYVTGHGHGHARRSAEVIKAFVRQFPKAQVLVHTTAPAGIFKHIPRTSLITGRPPIDIGGVEQDILTIDARATIAASEQLLAQKENVVRSEVELIRREAIDLIVADVPFLAGDVAAASGIPAMALSNFTWDWIFEPFVLNGIGEPAFLEQIRESYARMHCCLQLPFYHRMNFFSEVIPTPLVAQRTDRSREEILRDLNLPEGEDRPRVLFGMRSGVSGPLLIRAARQAPDFLFLSLEPLETDCAGNVIELKPRPGLGFVEAIAIADIVVSKLGYGIVADSIAAGTRLLYPPRTGFREDELTEAGAAGCIATRRIDVRDFLSGNWSADLRALMAAPNPGGKMLWNGAEFCAREMGKRLS
ncbi:MAG: hypothetical protein AB1813_11150 [Verrucomicrobiota bacterium]